MLCVFFPRYIFGEHLAWTSQFWKTQDIPIPPSKHVWLGRYFPKLIDLGYYPQNVNLHNTHIIALEFYSITPNKDGVIILGLQKQCGCFSMRDTDEKPCLMDNTLLELFMICLVLPHMFRQTQMPDHVPHHRRKTTKQIGVNPSLFMLNPYFPFLWFSSLSSIFPLFMADIPSLSAWLHINLL